MSSPVRSSETVELRMRCIEAALRSPFSNAEQVLVAAELWYGWVTLPPDPPKGRTSANRSLAEAKKKVSAY